MQIREAIPADHAGIWEMLMPVFRAGDSYAIDPDITRDEALDYWFGGERRVYVADDAGALIGTYYIVPNQKGGGRHVCNCGYVTAAAAQGRGVARAMLTHSLALAPRLGFTAMQYNFVLETNHRAIATWEKAGFEVVGRLPGAFAHPGQGAIDALVMYRHL